MHSKNRMKIAPETKKQTQSDDLTNYDHHKLQFDLIAKRFSVSLQNGLDAEYAASLLIKNGKNLLKQENKSLLAQTCGYLFTGFCGVLWIGALICFLAYKPIGNPADPTNLGLAFLLVIVILLQAAFSAFQDWSSNRVMRSIKNMMPSSATVIRNGIEKKIYAEELVVGDLVILSYGTKVPADIRLIETHDLKFDKSMLTGESESIESSVDCTSEMYTESKNIAFMTTLITNGQGKGIVVEVGETTMIGRIAKLTADTKNRETSLQKEIKRFVIFVVAIAISTVIVLVVVWKAWLCVHYPTYIDTSTMMVNLIGVLVGFIPTGLPVAVTLSLLLMARKMAKHKVLVKNLTTIETLSCVNVIASDKTGTLTQNKMFVASATAGMKSVDFNEKEKNASFYQLVNTSLLCNNASYIADSSDKQVPFSQRQTNGDATDIALLRFGSEYNKIENFSENYTELTEIPFNSKNKWMMKFLLSKDYKLHNDIFNQNLEENQNLMLLKGAPDILLMKCKTILREDGSEMSLESLNKFNLIQIQNEWCTLGQRVLLLCKKQYSNDEANEICMKNTNEMEKYINSLDDFCLIGMLGIIDPPREGIADVITKCKGAGIKVLMVTGDYSLTAAAIATEIGIFTNLNYDTVEMVKDKSKNMKILDTFNHSRINSLLINGSEIEQLTDNNWRIITKYDEIVLARTTPEQKLKTVNEFRKDGYIVAVTGDGVNDAPALKNADIGIAMGSGSEVAQEASQMVLLDNSFSSILIAIENGRLVFDNLRKVILYLLPAGSFAEVVPILVNIFLGVPLPLSAFLMICICILTDMFPALALMLEKPETDLLKRPPRSKNDHLVDISLIIQAYLFLGLMEAFFSHCLFFWYLQWYGGFQLRDILFGFDYWNSDYKGHSYEQIKEFIYTGQTITFIGLVIMQSFGNIFATRTNRLSLFQQSPFDSKTRNLWIFVAQSISIILMVLIVYLPYCNSLFNTRPPPLEFWFIPLIFAFIILVADEIRKLFVRKNILCFPHLAW